MCVCVCVCVCVCAHVVCVCVCVGICTFVFCVCVCVCARPCCVCVGILPLLSKQHAHTNTHNALERRYHQFSSEKTHSLPTSEVYSLVEILSYPACLYSVILLTQHTTLHYCSE